MIYLFIASINHPKKSYQSVQKTSEPFSSIPKIELEIETNNFTKEFAFIDSN